MTEPEAEPSIEDVDDILYLARVNEAAELQCLLVEVCEKMKLSRAQLLAKAVEPESQNCALHYAAANGHTDVIRLLLTPAPEPPASAFLNAVNEAGNTALHWAALNGHLECVKLLVQSGADVTMINRAGHDAVFEAEINDKGSVVDWLLGAVQELESGIGQTGEGPAGDEDTELMDSEA